MPKRRKKAAKKSPKKVTRAEIKRFEVFRIPLSKLGYTSRGKYYGTGPRLWDVYDGETNESHTIRAPNAREARERVMTDIKK